MKVGGIVLCGGRSSRMGKPKAWLPFGDETMLQRMVRIVGTVVDPVVVVAAPGQEVPTLPERTSIVRDAEEGRGPLQGLLAGLTALEGRADAAYVSSCDVPQLQPEFVRQMIESLGSYDIAYPFINRRPHPLAAVYRLMVRPLIEKLLKADRLRLASLFDLASAVPISREELIKVDPKLLSLRNLNSKEEYEAAVLESQR